jgi:hypothetical protein
MRLRLFLRDATSLVVAAALAGYVGILIATNGRTQAASLTPALVAVVFSLIAVVPGVALRIWVFQGANRFLAALVWRFSAALLAISLMFTWVGQERKTYVAALLTCYFTTLLLESGLEIYQSRNPAD